MDEHGAELSRGPLPGWVVPALFALGLWAVLATLAAVWALRQPVGPSVDGPPVAADDPEPTEPPKPELRLTAAAWTDLDSWSADDPRPALEALSTSCRALSRLPAERSMTPPGVGDPSLAGRFGRAADWQAVCGELASSRPSAGDAGAARRWIEERFVPWAVSDGSREDPRSAEGLFTGYYEPTLHGSRRRAGPYRYPLYRRPPELVAVDLGEFRPQMAGERIAGRLDGGRLVPFADRAELDGEALTGGSLAGRGLELAWVDDPIDAFFLHIQGSGRIELAEGGTLRLGYAGQNGHVYTAIGRELIERGELAREEVSMQSIRRWLLDHPERAAELMAVNRSYIFFRELTGPGPLGAQGVALTPGRSLAVDRTFLPLGAPLWLATEAPTAGPEAAAGATEPLRRLMVAQDTGGAIRGPVRGDVFWGPGDRAAAIAGRMKHPGRLWLLLPAQSVDPGADRQRDPGGQ